MNRENVKQAVNEIRTKLIEKPAATAQDFYDLDALLLESTHQSHFGLEYARSELRCLLCQSQQRQSHQQLSLPHVDDSLFLACRVCCECYHVACLGLTPDTARALPQFTCEGCAPTSPALTAMNDERSFTRLKKKSKNKASSMSLTIFVFYYYFYFYLSVLFFYLYFFCYYY
jgi:hypothetical protein